eukprot:Protomagalhaensia_sp_Gyna_25__484@NODE_1229_length_2045_cov_17_091226_g980_i0_p1_GENE_NODE_1229_length_2045_cov_17_091226_g980_i0NODE_1229_length_2045_cov_17_091226_g980_i0_p1_ORF_typecomplete_len644_score102_52ABC_tran/PF00005_27/1_1e31ABC2_membrane/PF01061_24/1_9e28AAA_21/PF13304_6/1_2e07AAA_16/PF13191_6/5_3e05AAA_16/PF13191_6/2_1e03AAA_15/PF13175_6/0_022AAA_29/PF13555_6/0_0003Rad51/PF08423_11/0_00049SMC_N/PF02463_19/23SMC_N/PF02463_19/0_0098SbcCD_C/PF13558_6/0_019SbcCD_C/PF13558_6/4e02AAA_25/
MNVNGISVVTRQLSAIAKTRKHELVHILRDVEFAAIPGELLAIMGPSGSGKTTLLNILSGRAAKALALSGEFQFNGRSYPPKRIRQIAAYVPQEDMFLEFLTVAETLTFASQLRLNGWSAKARAQRIEECLTDLGLQSCRDVYVGGTKIKGISGGQRKRVSIAVALLPNPQLLFLDEPTSGLDASLAYDVMKVLSNIARGHGRTVLCTIHQPRSQVYALFDALLLLREGSIVYRGPADQAVGFFAAMGYQCPSEFNPPDFFLDLLTEGGATAGKTAADIEEIEQRFAASGELAGPDLATLEPGTASDAPPASREVSIVRVVVASEKASKFSQEYQKSAFAAAQKEMVAELVARSGSLAMDESFSRKPTLGDWLFSVIVLVKRDLINGFRQPLELVAQAGSLLITAILVGTIWWQAEKPDPAGGCDNLTVLRNYLGGLIQAVSNVAFSANDISISVVKRRILINREHGSGLYSFTARMFSVRLSDMVLFYWGCLVMSLTSYWFIGLEAAAAQFFTYWVIICGLKFASDSWATFCGSIATTTTVAACLVPMGMVLFFFTSGMQLEDDAIPGWLRWIQNLSTVRFAFQGFARDQIQDSDFLNECASFRTPNSAWANIALLVAVGYGWSFIAYGIQYFFHRSRGLDS